MTRVSVALAALVAAAAAGTPAVHAETLRFRTELSGRNESPPNDSAATGRAEVTYDTLSRRLEWTVQFEGLTGNPIGGHLHGPAPAGANAGIMLPFKTLASPVRGSATLNPDQVKALTEGKLYVNIHTARHPGGEVRGQLVRE